MNRIAEIRREKNLRQRHLAEQLEIEQSAVSKLENEKVPLTLPQMRIIARVLGVTVGELEDPPRHPGDVAELADELSAMPPDKRALAIRLLRTLGKLAPSDAARLVAAADALLAPASDRQDQQEQ